MRTRKDPGIRQEVFIRAATELFMEKGCEAVSVREVLDAVGDKSASPSVLYYYFSSKDQLYRACVEAVADSYLAFMGEAFSAGGKTIGEWMLGLVSGLEEYLMNERNLIRMGKSSPNRSFVLDMKARVTGQAALLWAESLETFFGFPSARAESLARFLAGGVGEGMFHFMQGGRQDRDAVFAFTEDMVCLVMNAIGLPEDVKGPLRTALKEKHGRIAK